ncbi:hypothetical protein B0H12DRAFT_1074694 [Mycena haematopus]|nr:hypothetical protein B0H12DRAFT_1074694 [Mycena haematopus]
MYEQGPSSLYNTSKGLGGVEPNRSGAAVLSPGFSDNSSAGTTTDSEGESWTKNKMPGTHNMRGWLLLLARRTPTHDTARTERYKRASREGPCHVMEVRKEVAQARMREYYDAGGGRKPPLKSAELDEMCARGGGPGGWRGRGAQASTAS